MGTKDWIGALIALVVVLVVVGAVLGVAAYIAQAHTCTVGVSGTAANITYTGTNADSFCSHPEGWQYGESHFYTLDQPQGVTLCSGQVTLNGSTTTYTIRDTGMLDIVGSGLCKWYGEGLPSSP